MEQAKDMLATIQIPGVEVHGKLNVQRVFDVMASFISRKTNTEVTVKVTRLPEGK